MSDTKLLQTILDRVNSVDKKVDEVKVEVKITRQTLTKRIDKLGLQIAQLEDDAPTADEFEKLTKRITKLENQTSKKLTSAS